MNKGIGDASFHHMVEMANYISLNIGYEALWFILVFKGCLNQ